MSARQDAWSFEKQYVVDVYNDIAPSFSHSRFSIWDCVNRFLSTVPTSSISIVTDVGCGNGKNMKHFSNIHWIGFDVSENLAEIAKSKNTRHIGVCSALKMPMRSGVSDSTISVAVIHHISTVEGRVQFIREMLRVTVAGGRCLVSVWSNPEQCRQNNTMAKNMKFLSPNDILVDWKNQYDNGKISKRYYHIFTEQELVDVVVSAGGHVLDTVEERGNIFVTFIKKTKQV